MLGNMLSTYWKVWTVLTSKLVQEFFLKTNKFNKHKCNKLDEKMFIKINKTSKHYFDGPSDSVLKILFWNTNNNWNRRLFLCKNKTKSVSLCKLKYFKIFSRVGDLNCCYWMGFSVALGFDVKTYFLFYFN